MIIFGRLNTTLLGLELYSLFLRIISWETWNKIRELLSKSSRSRSFGLIRHIFMINRFSLSSCGSCWGTWDSSRNNASLFGWDLLITCMASDSMWGLIFSGMEVSLREVKAWRGWDSLRSLNSSLTCHRLIDSAFLYWCRGFTAIWWFLSFTILDKALWGIAMLKPWELHLRFTRITFAGIFGWGGLSFTQCNTTSCQCFVYCISWNLRGLFGITLTIRFITAIATIAWAFGQTITRIRCYRVARELRVYNTAWFGSFIGSLC